MGRRRRLGVLLICSTSLFVVGLDASIVNVALPSVGRDLKASVSGLQWAVDAYTLAFASLLMLSGSMADRLGRKRVFVAGLVVFTSSSLLCSVAPTVGSLIAFRVVQGVGASMLSPVALSIVTNTFTDARERAQAIGVWAAVFGVSTALGPVVGGLLVTGLGWRAIFVFNLPIGLAALALTIRFVPESRAERARRPDAVGQVFVIAVLASLTVGIIEGSHRGWASPLVLGAFSLSGTSLIGVVFWERRREEPLIDLRFFRSAPFSGAASIAIAAFIALGGFLFLNTLYLQDVRALSPSRAGLATVPMAAMSAVFAPVAGRIVSARGARIPLAIAGVGMTAGCAMLAAVTPTTPMWRLFAAYVIFGVGFGFVNAPVTNAAVSGMPRAQAGVAGAITSTARQVGQTLGVAVAGAFVAASAGFVSKRQDAGSGFLHFTTAARDGWWVLCGCGMAVLVLGLVVTSSWAKATALRTAQQLDPEFVGGAR